MRKPFIQTAIESVQGMVITHEKNVITASEWDAVARSNLSFIDVPYLVHLKVPESIGTNTAISILRQYPDVEYAEPNVKFHLCTEDDRYPDQWSLYNDGHTGGIDDADIDAPEAWNIFTGDPNFVVAVIDTGIDRYHEDLTDNIWHNPGESGMQAHDGIDNDNNGYIDDSIGWNFKYNNWDTWDDVGHGTHVAGIIGAKANNTHGIAGVCWNVKIMAVKWNLELTTAAPAIYYAVNNGAKVINASWGDDCQFLWTLFNAINYARSKGVLFVAAAGNIKPPAPHPNNDLYPYYPASFNLSNIISVLSTDHADFLSYFSHYGATSIDLGAPGGSAVPAGNIISTLPDLFEGNNYGYMQGTSQATPHVVGAAALTWGKCPQLTYSQLKARILEKTDMLPDLYGKCVSDGRLNLYNLIYDSATPDGIPGLISAECYSWQSIHLTWSDNSSNEIGFELQRQKAGESEFSSISSIDKNYTSCTDTSAYGNIATFYKIRSYNMAGTSSFSDILTYTIPATEPSAPSNLSAPEWCIEYNVELSWDDNANNEQAFAVERSSGESGIWGEIGTAWTDPNVASPTITWTDTMVSTGTYYYRVKAKNPAGSSNYSNEVYVVVGIYDF
ncbi:MAG: S8 family serine peptidase [Planctomycetes bacterium]|nr:S8 family serine peptidase [Planctomycetota bacterium]